MTPNDTLALLALCLVGGALALPLVRALARRIEIRGEARLVAARPVAEDERLRRIEQAIETMAVEVERIAEGQRFTTKLLSERAAEPATPGTGR